MYKDFVRAIQKKIKGVNKKSTRQTEKRRTIFDDGETNDYVTRRLKKELQRVTKSSSGPPRIRVVFEGERKAFGRTQLLYFRCH